MRPKFFYMTNTTHLYTLDSVSGIGPRSILTSGGYAPWSYTPSKGSVRQPEGLPIAMRDVS